MRLPAATASSCWSTRLHAAPLSRCTDIFGARCATALPADGFLPQGPPPAGYPTQTQQAWGQPEPGKQQWGGYPPQQQQQPGAYPPPQPQAYGGYGAPPPQQAYGQAPPPPPPVERTPSHSMLTVNVGALAAACSAHGVRVNVRALR